MFLGILCAVSSPITVRSLVFLFGRYTDNTLLLVHHTWENRGGSILVLFIKLVCFVLFKKNLNASKPSEHPPQVEECLKV